MNKLVWLFCFLFAHDAVAQETTTVDLEVGLLVASKGQRQVYYELARKFEAEHPHINVTYVAKDDAGYKSSIEGWLTAERGLDLLYWQAGEPLFQFVRRGLIESLDLQWQQQQWYSDFPPNVQDVVSIDGSPYGLPYSYYQWGFYYKKSLFSKLSLQPPTTWPEFLEICRRLKAQGISPIVLGSKNHWPTASWFDYFNLRINGLEFHRQLLQGQISYRDKRVAEVFKTWKVLIDRDYFVKSSSTLMWKEGLPYLYRDLAGMMLIGNFVEQHFPKNLARDIGFFRFPQINADVAYYEEAPMEIFILPINSRHKKEAKQFLAFIGRANIQASLNDGLGYIPPHIHAKKSSSYFIQQGSETLREAQGLSQFYDRDTNRKMAAAGIKILSAFSRSGNIETAIAALEKQRLESAN